MPVVKAAAAVGLLSITRFPALARLTTAMLTLYFALAVGAHIRVRDKVVNGLPAAVVFGAFRRHDGEGTGPELISRRRRRRLQRRQRMRAGGKGGVGKPPGVDVGATLAGGDSGAG